MNKLGIVPTRLLKPGRASDFPPGSFMLDNQGDLLLLGSDHRSSMWLMGEQAFQAWDSATWSPRGLRIDGASLNVDLHSLVKVPGRDLKPGHVVFQSGQAGFVCERNRVQVALGLDGVFQDMLHGEFLGFSRWELVVKDGDQRIVLLRHGFDDAA